MVPGLAEAMRAFSQEPFEGLIVHGLSAGELTTFAHFSLRRPLPPAVVITDEVAILILWISAATSSTAGSSIAPLLGRLVLMIDAVSSGTAANLPLRLSTTASKWTRRLRAPSLVAEAPFDGVTSDDLCLDPGSSTDAR